jgi:prenyl protein peptidase
MVSLLFASRFSIISIVWIAPLFFGIAHAHHGYTLYKERGCTKEALTSAILISCTYFSLHNLRRCPKITLSIKLAFQFAYTTVFGWFATWVLLRTGSILTVIVSHALCNYFGFPDFSYLSRCSASIQRAVYMSTFLGVIGFCGLLLPMTNNPQSVYLRSF